MSIWSGIKYALNSTLGTKDFKPLDRLLKDVDGLVASNQLYQIVFQEERIPISASGLPTLMPKNIKINSNGSIEIRIYFERSHSTDNKYQDIIVTTLINNEEIKNSTISITTETSKSYSETILVNKGDVISYKFKRTGDNASIVLTSAKVYATPINLSGITIY